MRRWYDNEIVGGSGVTRLSRNSTSNDRNRHSAKKRRHLIACILFHGTSSIKIDLKNGNWVFTISDGLQLPRRGLRCFFVVLPAITRSRLFSWRGVFVRQTRAGSI